MSRRIFVFAILTHFLTNVASYAEPYLKSGDRVILVGNTMIEREPRYGFWETELTRLAPQADLRFRNLGWSGDTVWGEARAGFDNPEKGYQRLIELALASKPTVILVGYGTNESFAGESGLKKFEESYRRLLRDLAPAKAKLVFITPTPMQQRLISSRETSQHNQNISIYTESIRKLAKEQKAPLIDLHLRLSSSNNPELTDNGMHLTNLGYASTAPIISEALGFSETPSWKVTLKKGQAIEATGTSVKWLDESELSFETLDSTLPSPSIAGQKNEPRILKFSDCPDGAFDVKIDDKIVTRVQATALRKGVDLLLTPERSQVEDLRQTITKKNELHFHRWRPQNETYLFGFRKHEQGRNAAEIVQFDPLIEELEQRIAKLRKPTKHIYQLIAVTGK
jgi:lysophospholipase L1-like esterase